MRDENNEFEILADEIRRAVTATAIELFASGEKFYYFVLSTTGEGLAPYVCASSHEAFAREAAKRGWSEDEMRDSRYSSIYAPYFDAGSQYFARVRELFESRPQSWDEEGEFEFRLRAMVRALKDCDASGIFAKNQPRGDIVINVEILPPDRGNIARAKTLNPSAALQKWLINSGEAELECELEAADERIYASAKRAFADAVCEKIGKIDVRIEDETLMVEIFASDELSEDERESVSVATSEILADFARVKREKISVNFI